MNTDRSLTGSQNEDGEWKTIHGSPVFIRTGQSVDAALKRRDDDDDAPDSFAAHAASEKAERVGAKADKENTAKGHEKAMRAHRFAGDAAKRAGKESLAKRHFDKADEHSSKSFAPMFHKPSTTLTGLASAIGAATVTAKDPNDLWVVYIPKGQRDVPEQTLDLQPVLDDKGQPKVMRVNVSQLSAKRLEAARQKIERAGGNQPYCDFNHDDAESSGRPKQFAWHDELGVVCRIGRTLTGVAKTSGDPAEFQAFSPHAAMDDNGEAAGLYLNCGGFVNRPLFGDANNISAAARLTQELVAADPNDIAQVSAELGDVATETAAQTGAEKQMKELIAKLCAKWKLDPAKATEAELISAFEQEQTGITTLTAKAALAEPVIVALGFDKAATPKPEELTGKIADLSKPPANVVQLSDYAKELTGLAVGVGLISPAEQATWERRITLDRANEVKELTAKKPTVPLGTVVTGDPAGAGAAGNGAQQAAWEKELNELVAKDANLVAVAATDMPRAKTLGMQKLMREKPALFAVAK